MRLSYFILFVSLLTACSPNEKSETVATAPSSATEVIVSTEQLKAIGIRLGKPENKTLGNTIKANGMLDVPPQNLVTIAAPMGGFVKKTELLQGMKVSKGQVLAVMEHPDYIQLQQDYLDGKSQLEFLQQEYKRQEELAKENINATKTLQQSRSGYLSMKAKVEGLRARLKMINIDSEELEQGTIRSTVNLYSPISGYVTQVHVNVGMFVNPANIMFKIVDNHHLHAEIQVYEKDILQVKVGQKIRLKLVNESHDRIASVYLIGKEITADRTIRVHGHFASEDPTLLPGMYFSAIIETGEQKVQSLPEQAFVNFEGKDYVFVSLGNNRFSITPAIKGSCESGFCQVSFVGVTPDAIVVEGAYALLSLLKNKGE